MPSPLGLVAKTGTSVIGPAPLAFSDRSPFDHRVEPMFLFLISSFLVHILVVDCFLPLFLLNLPSIFYSHTISFHWYLILLRPPISLRKFGCLIPSQ